MSMIYCFSFSLFPASIVRNFHFGSTPTAPPICRVRLPCTSATSCREYYLHTTCPTHSSTCLAATLRLSIGSATSFFPSCSLKRKLAPPLYHPASAPVCKCGTTHDIYGHHHFRCRCIRISKKATHNYINEYGLQPALQQVLLTVGIINASSIVQTRTKTKQRLLT